MIKTHQDLLAYWQQKRGDRLAPTRGDIEPLDFPKLWGNILMYKVHHDQPENINTLRGNSDNF